MQKISRAVVGATFVALVALSGLTACSTGSDAVTDVSAAQAVAVLQDEKPTVIDVRTAGEYAAGHLPGAINIDVEAPGFADSVSQLPKDESYFVYCRSGNRSGVATEQMAQLGFTDLYDLQGGITDWQATGGSVVTS
jgi:rhodanese-related sulfurtransferase